MADQFLQAVGHTIDAAGDFAHRVCAFKLAARAQIPLRNGFGDFGNALEFADKQAIDQKVVGNANHQPGNDAPGDEPDQHAGFPLHEQVGIEGKNQRDT